MENVTKHMARRDENIKAAKNNSNFTTIFLIKKKF